MGCITSNPNCFRRHKQPVFQKLSTHEPLKTDDFQSARVHRSQLIVNSPVQQINQNMAIVITTSRVVLPDVKESWQDAFTNRVALLFKEALEQTVVLPCAQYGIQIQVKLFVLESKQEYDETFRQPFLDWLKDKQSQNIEIQHYDFHGFTPYQGIWSVSHSETDSDSGFSNHVVDFADLLLFNNKLTTESPASDSAPFDLLSHLLMKDKHTSTGCNVRILENQSSIMILNQHALQHNAVVRSMVFNWNSHLNETNQAEKLSLLVDQIALWIYQRIHERTYFL